MRDELCLACGTGSHRASSRASRRQRSVLPVPCSGGRGEAETRGCATRCVRRKSVSRPREELDWVLTCLGKTALWNPVFPLKSLLVGPLQHAGLGSPSCRCLKKRWRSEGRTCWGFTAFAWLLGRTGINFWATRFEGGTERTFPTWAAKSSCCSGPEIDPPVDDFKDRNLFLIPGFLLREIRTRKFKFYIKKRIRIGTFCFKNKRGQNCNSPGNNLRLKCFKTSPKLMRRIFQWYLLSSEGSSPGKPLARQRLHAVSHVLEIRPLPECAEGVFL